MLRKILIITFSLIFLFSLPSSFAFDCHRCLVGDCFCNMTECSNGRLSVYLTRCTGIPVKEFTFENSSFVWIDVQPKNYYFEAFCDSGEISNCTNVNLVSTTSPQSLANCPYECCVNEAGYKNNFCGSDEKCTNNVCVASKSISYSLIGIIAAIVAIGVVVFYFLHGKLSGKNTTSAYETLKQKWRKR